MRELFTAFAMKAAHLVGTYWAFLLAVLIVVVWALTGRLFNYSDTWQLVINTGTTIITFLMVFLIQNTQNRDAKAMHLKLDELISSVKAAHNEMIDIEHLSDEQLEDIAAYYKKKRDECGEDSLHTAVKDAAEQAASQAVDKARTGIKDEVKGDARRVAADTAREVSEDSKKVA